MITTQSLRDEEKVMSQGLNKLIKHWVRALREPKRLTAVQWNDMESCAVQLNGGEDDAERLYKEICRECHRIEQMTGIHINPS